MWGLNVGQFGIGIHDDKLMQPKRINTLSHSIVLVDSSDAAIACLTTAGSILLYTKSKVKTLRKPILHENIKHMAVRGGEIYTSLLQEKRAPEPLEILVIMESDVVFLWSNEANKYLRCECSHSMPKQKIYWSGENVVVLSTDGNLFIGEIVKRAIDRSNSSDSSKEFVEQKSNRRQDIDETNCYEMVMKRMPYIDRVTDVSMDQTGESFVILQESSKRYLTFPLLPDDPISFKALLTEVNELDRLHDVVFHVTKIPKPNYSYHSLNRSLISFTGRRRNIPGPQVYRLLASRGFA